MRRCSWVASGSAAIHSDPTSRGVTSAIVAAAVEQGKDVLAPTHRGRVGGVILT